MKNTALVLTSSTITTIFVLIGIFAANPQMHVDLMMGIWVNWWEPNVLGWIIVCIICATAVLTFVFTAGKQIANILYFRCYYRSISWNFIGYDNIYGRGNLLDALI